MWLVWNSDPIVVKVVQYTTYAFNMNLQDFGAAGFDPGTYEIVLFLGDFLIEDSAEWVLGDVNFKVGSADHQPKQRPTPNPLYSISYQVKPEIKVRFYLSSHNKFKEILW